MKHPLKVGLFGIGLDAYWDQFEGLKEKLLGYLTIVETKLKRDDVQIVNLGLIDTTEKAVDAGHHFRQKDVDKVGRGLSVEMAVKHGPVTLLSVVEGAAGKLIFLIAEGDSVAGPILEIGNTNSRYRFSIGARRFVNDWNSHGPAHHCAVGVGAIAAKIKKLGNILGIETIQVC